MHKASKIYIAGHRGLVGSALVRCLENHGFSNLVCLSSQELNLINQAAVNDFFQQEKPEYVFLAAAKVGGILANNEHRGEFIYENLMIQSNVIHAAHQNMVRKLLFLGSSCIYPKMSPQPIKEEYLLSGYLEPTNEPYAIAKIAGLKMCESYRKQYGSQFISAMPTNIYGPNDNFDLQSSHVLPALLRKFIEAKNNNQDEVVMWGTGEPLREFLHVDDLAEALIFMMLHYNGDEFLNIGCGKDISIKDLALMIKSIVGYEGRIVHDLTKPDGTPKKLLDVTKLKDLGWTPKYSLEEGIRSVYELVKDRF